MSKFLSRPPSVRAAASVIVTAYATVVVLGGVLMRVLDHEEYANVWVGMWWALQTVTTVGYGDVTPKHFSGRIVAAFVMLEGIAFLLIIIAAITSTFVERAQREHQKQEEKEEKEQGKVEDRIDAKLDALNERLDRVEALLRASPPR